MKIEMFSASGEAITATVMAAAVLLGVAAGSAPTQALASTPSDTETALGSSAFAITGDSMEPSIPRGALTMAQLVEPDQVRVGDIVTVRLSGALVTRRVVGSDAITAGRLLTLQADASANAEDIGVMFTDRATVVRAYIPVIGYAADLAARFGRGALGLGSIALLGLVVLGRWQMRRPRSLAPGTLPAPVPS
jgi:signal peptidase